MIDEQINSLKEELVDYASLVENMIDKSIRGLTGKNEELLNSTIKQDEPEANSLEIEIDEHCVQLLAQYEPKAKLLRVVLMILKMNNDLERIADHAVNISQSSLYLIDRPPLDSLYSLPKLGKKTKEMLNDSITAFINEDDELAGEVCEMDNSVDDLRYKILRELIDVMREEPEAIERAMHMERISKNFERIGDLSTNLCEEIIYIVNGKIIKHHSEDEIKE